MKQEIYKVLEYKKIVLKNLQQIELCKFSKKRILAAIIGVDRDGFYNLIFFRNSKSRFLKKEFEDIESISEKIIVDIDINIKKKTIFYNSDICSKTIKSLQESGWKYDTM